MLSQSSKWRSGLRLIILTNLLLYLFSMPLHQISHLDEDGVGQERVSRAVQNDLLPAVPDACFFGLTSHSSLSGQNSAADLRYFPSAGRLLISHSLMPVKKITHSRHPLRAPPIF